jgi:hypothetical protein
MQNEDIKFSLQRIVIPDRSVGQRHSDRRSYKSVPEGLSIRYDHRPRYHEASSSVSKAASFINSRSNTVA